LGEKDRLILELQNASVLLALPSSGFENEEQSNSSPDKVVQRRKCQVGSRQPHALRKEEVSLGFVVLFRR